MKNRVSTHQVRYGIPSLTIPNEGIILNCTAIVGRRSIKGEREGPLESGQVRSSGTGVANHSIRPLTIEVLK
jgi:hypothetical protein